MTVKPTPRGILIQDAGAPLTGCCRPSQSRGRFCRGAYDGVDVDLGDGDDRIQHDYNGLIDGGTGDDEILGTGGPFRLIGGAGADGLEANGISGSSVSYLDHAEGVTVRLNPVASTVPCEGRLWLHLRNGRRISRVVGFGPVEPGSRIRVNVRRRAPVPRGTCLYATTVTRRGDGLRTTTTTVSPLFCLPR